MIQSLVTEAYLCQFQLVIDIQNFKIQTLNFFLVLLKNLIFFK
jgi:hypothetical protein